jgi:sulfur-oxidizing protein SoxX
MKRLFLAAIVLAFAQPALAGETPKTDMTAVFKSMFKKIPEGWGSRLEQDETQRVCSETRNNPSPAQAKAILEREGKNVVYPADGNVMGDWTKGEKLAQNGYGGRFTDTDPKKDNGGNCYACHQLAIKEISYGTIGPSLIQYGKLRDFKPEAAKETYARIYNPQAQIACALMPRFGHNKFLSEQQMKDLTAFLMSPESPVNK